MHPPPIRPSLRPSNLTGKVGKEKTVRRSRYSVSADKKNPSMRHRKGLIHGVYMDGISADIEADSLSHLVLCFWSHSLTVTSLSPSLPFISGNGGGEVVWVIDPFWITPWEVRKPASNELFYQIYKLNPNFGGIPTYFFHGKLFLSFSFSFFFYLSVYLFIYLVCCEQLTCECLYWTTIRVIKRKYSVFISSSYLIVHSRFIFFTCPS